MASSSGDSSGSSGQPPNSGSEEILQVAMDQKKRKRMLSNRESARRSRMRKQKHQDDLTVQVSQLKKDNAQILAVLNLRSQSFLAVDADNSVLRTQMMELTSRLDSLTEILQFMNLYRAGGESQMMGFESFFNPWNQPIMASSDMIPFY